MRLFLFLGSLCLAMPALAEQVVLGLSQSKVAITATFDGSEILVFGAVKRETPIPEDKMDVIIAIAGPKEPAIVRHKERRAGIWVNVDSVTIDAAPTYYAVATTGPLGEVLSNVEDLRNKISIPNAIRSVGAPSGVADPQSFVDALIRIREDEGAYQMLEGAVSFDEQTLFRSAFSLPSNLTEGTYPTRIFLTRDGRVVSSLETVIEVHKVGLERWLFVLSRQKPLIYGLLSLAIAIVAGWMASAIFDRLKRA